MQRTWAVLEKISNEPSAFEVLGDCFEDRALGLGYRLSP